MPKKATLVVNSNILIWARKSIGFSISEAAEKAKIARKNIEIWESKDGPVSLVDLKKLAKTYKRPLTTFFLKNLPEKSTLPPDFRTLDSVKLENLSSNVRLAIRQAQRNRKFLARLNTETNQPPVELVGISFSDNPIDLAKKFREILKITIDQQVQWKDEYQAFYSWIDAIEKNGISIFHMDLPIKEFRGFCLRGDEFPPAIVVNRKDRVRGRIFTLFHEFYHLHLREKDIQQLTDSRGTKDAHMLIEMKANEFAGSFLVPAEFFLECDYTKKYIDTRDDELIVRLKNIFKVSAEVIYRRLLVHNFLSEEEYKLKREALLKIYRQEDIEKKKKIEESKKPFIRNYAREVVSNVGFSLANRAFSAAADGKINAFDLVSFLDVKLSYLDKLRQQVDKHYRRPN